MCAWHSEFMQRHAVQNGLHRRICDASDNTSIVLDESALLRRVMQHSASHIQIRQRHRDIDFRNDFSSDRAIHFAMGPTKFSHFAAVHEMLCLCSPAHTVITLTHIGRHIVYSKLAQLFALHSLLASSDAFLGCAATPYFTDFQTGILAVKPTPCTRMLHFAFRHNDSPFSRVRLF